MNTMSTGGQAQAVLDAYESALTLISANQEVLHRLMDAHPEPGGPFEAAKEAARAVTVDAHLLLSRIRAQMPESLRAELEGAA